MKLGIFCVRDTKTGYMTPNVDMNFPSAIRNFTHAIMNTDSLFHSHAEDYELYHLGDFDTDSGIITPRQKPEFIRDGISLKNKEV